MRQILPGVYAHSRVSSFQYFIVEGRDITLIDAGLPLFAGALIRALVSLEGDAQLRSILITHADGDHYGAVKRLQHNHTIQVASSAPEAKAMAVGGMSRDLKPRNAWERFLFNTALPTFTAPPVMADTILQPGDILPMLGGMQVLDSAGHTPGHLSFYQPERRLLFAGDSIIKRKGIPSPAFGSNCWDEKLAQVAFDRQIALQPLHICGGHSYFNLSK
jgi:glyoxylase-like metal-dependent hydrolase (beta-lactamase superfamily II)